MVVFRHRRWNDFVLSDCNGHFQEVKVVLEQGIVVKYKQLLPMR